MSSTLREQKKMWLAAAVLRRAAGLLPVELPGPQPSSNRSEIEVASARDTNLKHLDFLEELARDRDDLRGGFWRDLMRVSEMLGSPERLARATEHYREALQRAEDFQRQTVPGMHLFSMSNGEVTAWVAGGIHLKAVTPDGDPIQLSAKEARHLVDALTRLIGELEAE